MFERIKSMFRKKPEEKRVEELTLEEAEKFYKERLAGMEKEALEKCRTAQATITNRFSTLKSLFTALAEANIQEERAASSKVVKDRFAARALEIVDTTPGNELNSIADMRKFYYDVTDILSALGNITPKQAIHIQFFFGEQMSKIAAETENICKDARSVNEILEPLLRKEDALDSAFYEIASLQNGIRSDQERINQVLDDIIELKKRKEGMNIEDLSELESLREKLKDLIKKRREFKHRIETDFSSVARLLKKYRYHEQYSSKRDVKLLDEYIEQPHEAFLADDDMKIKKFLDEAVLLATSGDIDIDVKTIQRVETIFDNFDDLKKMKEEDAEITQEMEAIQRVIEKEWLPKVNHNDMVERRIREMDGRIGKNEAEHLNLLKEKTEKEQKIADAKLRIAEMLKDFSGVEVKIVS